MNKVEAALPDLIFSEIPGPNLYAISGMNSDDLHVGNDLLGAYGSDIESLKTCRICCVAVAPAIPIRPSKSSLRIKSSKKVYTIFASKFNSE